MRLKLSKILIFFSAVAIFVIGAVLFLSLDKRFKKDSVLGEKKRDIASLRCPDCNVILIGIDTLRADHLSSYGYYRDTSPNIDKFAEKGVLFKNTFSASSRTTPSFMSMLTSLYPTDHGVLTTLDPTSKNINYARINDSVRTIAQILKEQGYITQALVSSPQLPVEFGFDKGFDNYEFEELYVNRDKLLQWLENNKDRKYFVFFHDMGPHYPYAPQRAYDTLYDPEYKGKITTELPDVPEVVNMNRANTLEETLQKMLAHKEAVDDYFWSNVDKNSQVDTRHLEALYDGEIKSLDEFIGQVQDVLLETGLIKNTIIIFTADHGEEFFEHGDFKHKQVYNEILKVPFILTSPSIKQKMQINKYVRTIDIMPSILDFLNIPSSVPVRGKSLLPIIQDPSREMNLPIIAVQYAHNIPPIQTIIKDSYKLIRNFTDSKPSYELYDLDSDPKELLNVTDENRELSNVLSNDLQELLNDTQYIYKPIPLNLNLEEDKRKKLESLGY